MIRIEGPTDPIATLEDARLQARIDGDDEDYLIQIYLDAATAWVDGFGGVLGRCVMPQTWRAAADEVACGWKPMDVVSETVNEDGTVDFVCAMPAEKVALVKQAVLMLTAYWIDQRMAATASRLTDQRFDDAPLAVRSLLSAVRVWI